MKTLAIGFVGMVLFWLAFLAIGWGLQARQDFERHYYRELLK